MAVAVALATVPAGAAVPQAWFKADALALAEGAAVTLWADASKSGHVAQGGAVAPTFSATRMNGFPAVHFNGTQTMVFARPVQDDFTIMVLFRTPAGAGGSDNFYAGCGLVSGEQPGYTNDYGMSIRDNGRVLAGTGNPDTTLVSNSNGGLGYDNDQPHIATFTRVRSTGALALYVDRALRRTGTGGTQSLNVFSQICIGAHPGNIGPFLNGDIAEIIVFEGALTDSEVLAHEDALRGKYGLANGSAPFTPSNPAADGNRITWDEAPGARSYQVHRCDAPDGTFSIVAENLTATEYVDTSAAAGGTFYYRIVAVNGVGTSAPSPTVEGVTLALPDNGPVVINEIHYNGLDNSLHSDFIELFNFSSSAADIGGWRLSSGIDYIFPAGTVMPAGGYLVIAADPPTIQALWGITALGPYEKSLSSDGETIRLRDAADQIVSEVTYGSGFPWPCAANGEGASAELVNPYLDATKGSSWRSSVMTTTELSGETASPGAQNRQFALNPPPNIEDVARQPLNPTAGAPITVTARLADSDGIAGAQLSYQVVAPGSFIPAQLPLPIVNHNIDTSLPRPANPDFEDPANWTVVAMADDGTNGDAMAGDGVFTAVIPGQAHRTLVRYRVSATDGLGVSVRAPFADDASRNFACFVYDGVPDYQGVPAATLNTLPVYHFLTRKADHDQCVAYDSINQLTGNTPGWTYENWEGALVFEGVVYDHIRYRLHGGNGRYYYTSKRGFRFFFNKGYHFQNRDNDGNLLPTKWKSLTTQNGWENRGTLTYSLNEMINYHLWQQIGIPAPRANWGHFRTVTTAAEQADAWHGDFWGLILIEEDYNGDFLDSHGLAKGNLYKLTRDATDGASQLRYQAPDAVSDGSDHGNIYHNLTTDKDDAFIRRYVNVNKWSYYHALCHAVRHYDYWPTGDNNGAYYFEPDFTDQTIPLGKLWVLPFDTDATWGPTWNEGKDKVWSAIFDSPANPAFYPEYFNAVREVRDLLWQQDQINPLIDEFAAVIAPFIAADSIRWKGAPADAGNYNGLGGAGITSLAALVQDMRNFAWVGGSWPGGGVGAGGQAAFLDTLQLGVSNSEGSTIPATPAITYTGPVGYPANGLRFQTTAFSDPQGAGDFAALQWRVAEVTDPTAPAYDPAAKRLLEWNASYLSEPLSTFADEFVFPDTACQAGHTYRARVRMQDTSGRWSHWSAPVEFTATAAAGVEDLLENLVVSEINYHPLEPSTPAEQAVTSDKNDFEFIELRNISSGLTLDLTQLAFTSGITFSFAGSAVTSLAPGGRVVVVKNVAAFEARYGTGLPVAGAYPNSLDNAGERIVLAAGGATARDFTYDDAPPWPVSPDGDGPTLVLANPSANPDHGVAANWRASAVIGGTPGLEEAVVTLGGLAQTYDGSAREVAVTTEPAGLAVTLTYDGSAAAPVGAGAYAVLATVVEPGFVGSATGTLVVAKAQQAIVFNPPSSCPLDGPPLELAATATSGLPVSFEMVSGPGSLAGGVLSLMAGGEVVVRATQAGDPNHEPAAPVERAIAVTTGWDDSYWRMTRFTTAELEDASVSGAMADPEGDGLANLLEYAMMLDPHRYDVPPVAPTVVEESGIAYHAVVFRRRVPNPQIDYAPEVSTDLADWRSTAADMAPFGTPSANHDGTETVVYRSMVPAVSVPREFFRLRVRVAP